MTWTIEISLIDMICRYVAGIGTIIVLILILWEQKKLRNLLKKNSKDEKARMIE